MGFLRSCLTIPSLDPVALAAVEAGGGRLVLSWADQWQHALEGVTHLDQNILIPGFYLMSQGWDETGEAALRFSCLGPLGRPGRGAQP